MFFFFCLFVVVRLKGKELGFLFWFSIYSDLFFFGLGGRQKKKMTELKAISRRSALHAFLRTRTPTQKSHAPVLVPTSTIHSKVVSTVFTEMVGRRRLRRQATSGGCSGGGKGNRAVLNSIQGGQKHNNKNNDYTISVNKRTSIRGD